MFSARTLLGAAALTVATLGFSASSPAIAGVVVKSSGPSAGQFPVGKKLDDSATITLKAGDSVTVLSDGGTRVISGAGTHRVGARGESKRSAFAVLTRQRSGARVRTGAVRGGSGAVDAANANLWNVDVTKTGKVCVADTSAVTLWRPGSEGEATYMFAVPGSDFHTHVTFADGDATASVDADQLPLTANRAYQLSGPRGTASRSVEFVMLDTVPDNPEALASALAEKGCGNQLDLLAKTLMTS